MPSLREAQKQLTRDTIVERALELFTKKGYAATTIEEIAASAGTTRVTFYAYYPTRADLMRDFMARVNAVLERADGPDSGSTAPDLVQVVRDGKLAGILSWLESRAALWPVFRPYLDVLDEAAAVDPEVRTMVERWHEEVITDMVRGMQLAGRGADSEFTNLSRVSERWKGAFSERCLQLISFSFQEEQRWTISQKATPPISV